MDMRDLFYIGSNILDEVTDAVVTGDYSGLSESLRQMNEEMQKSAARVREEQERYRQQYQERNRPERPHGSAERKQPADRKYPEYRAAAAGSEPY